MEIVVTMSKRAYDFYTKSKKKGGAGLDKKGLIAYLDRMGGFIGKVVGISVEDDAVEVLDEDA